MQGKFPLHPRPYAEVARLLGEPSKREEKGPARIWHYASNGCRVDVYFFPELATLKYRVLRVEVAGAAADPTTGRGCFEELVVAARGRA